MSCRFVPATPPGSRQPLAASTRPPCPPAPPPAAAHLRDAGHSCVCVEVEVSTQAGWRTSGPCAAARCRSAWRLWTRQSASGWVGRPAPGHGCTRTSAASSSEGRLREALCTRPERTAAGACPQGRCPARSHCMVGCNGSASAQAGPTRLQAPPHTAGCPGAPGGAGGGQPQGGGLWGWGLG